jgi:hypothetical protein
MPAAFAAVKNDFTTSTFVAPFGPSVLCGVTGGMADFMVRCCNGGLAVLQSCDIIHGGTGGSGHPRRMPLVTRMAARQAELNGIFEC